MAALLAVLPTALPADGPATAPASQPGRPLYLIIAPKLFYTAAGPLITHRQADGYDVHLAEPPARKALAGLGRRPACILLIGDDLHPAPTSRPAWQNPAPRANFYRWSARQKPTFAADAKLGDLDGNGTPEVPVGRFPARTPAELSAMIDKLIAFEARPLHPADGRVLLWAGSANYSPTLDAMATGMAVGLLEQVAPPWLGGFLLAGDANSPWAGHPPDQPAVFLREYRRGALLAALVGHASETQFYSMAYRGQPITLGRDNVTAALARGKPGPPMILLTCLAGRFDSPETSLAEALLAAPAGPVAVIAATTESHPLPNLYSAQALLPLLDGQTVRLGALWCAAQQRMHATRNFLLVAALRAAEGQLQKAGPLDVARLQDDQLLLYALLGDPATKLKFPSTIPAATTRRPPAGPSSRPATESPDPPGD